MSIFEANEFLKKVLDDRDKQHGVGGVYSVRLQNGDAYIEVVGLKKDAANLLFNRIQGNGITNITVALILLKNGKKVAEFLITASRASEMDERFFQALGSYAISIETNKGGIVRVNYLSKEIAQLMFNQIGEHNKTNMIAELYLLNKLIIIDEDRLPNVFTNPE